MVQDPNTNDLIRWSNDGDSFLVPSPDRFGRELLPRFFKHSNFGSFVRQLNMYGFHKVPHLQHGVLKNDYEEQNELRESSIPPSSAPLTGSFPVEFSNPNFTREQPDLLCLIRRQKARADTAVSSESALDLPSLLTDLAAIRKHQTALSADLKDLETSNRALWEEAIQSRERHTRHQETINKILRFLATVFGGQVGGAENESPREARAEDVSSDLKGKGKETDRAPMPAVRSRLLLEDVKERRDARARERQFEEEVDEDDMIEEIGLQDDAMNAGSCTSLYPSFSRGLTDGILSIVPLPSKAAPSALARLDWLHILPRQHERDQRRTLPAPTGRPEFVAQPVQLEQPRGVHAVAERRTTESSNPRTVQQQQPSAQLDYPLDPATCPRLAPANAPRRSARGLLPGDSRPRRGVAGGAEREGGHRRSHHRARGGHRKTHAGTTGRNKGRLGKRRRRCSGWSWWKSGRWRWVGRRTRLGPRCWRCSRV